MTLVVGTKLDSLTVQSLLYIGFRGLGLLARFVASAFTSICIVAQLRACFIIIFPVMSIHHENHRSVVSVATACGLDD
jgi:hypothetical protein